jgi:signal transduction histidine kinase
MPLPSFTRSNDDRIVAGVCGGIAAALDVDVTLVRLVFALLALAGGAGILLYFALWAFSTEAPPWWAWVLLWLGSVALLQALGLPFRAVAGISLIAAGLLIAWRRSRGFRPEARLPLGGLAVAAAGAILLLSSGGHTTHVLAPGGIAGALLLVGGPWLWQLAVERDEERAARIRTQERADVATRVHDSVLQTLALIQRHAEEPRRVAAIARRQERELRGWLYGDQPLGDDGSSLVAALSAAAADVEELHGVRIEIVSAGDCPAAEPLVLAAREAMTNAAKFAGVEEIDVYVEVGEDEATVYVRDRGAGFDRARVAPERRGLAESVEGRLARADGSATVTSAPGAGTEVELRLPVRDAS